jgi:hypothetical protein
MTNHLRNCAAAVLGLALLAGPASAQHTFDGNIIYNNGSVFADGTGTGCGAIAIASAFNDVGVAPMLGNPIFPNQNWVPAEASIANGDNDQVAVIRHDVTDACASLGDACGYTRNFTQVCYRGAVPPASQGADWTQGWTCYDNLGDCRGAVAAPVFLSGPQATSHWTAGNTYVLQGKVSFPSGTTLTIDPGTIVIGENATQGYLVIDRGAQIFANGTVGSPIVMTTDLVPPTPGGWGGLVIHGRAIANCADCLGGGSCVSEGGAGDYCGTNDCDNSGSLQYVRVQYAGVEISLDNELNAFTFNGVGANTQASYLQAHMGSDDLFEWFGGTMNANHLVGTGGQDDGLDWQMGFRGTIQFAVIQMWATGERGIEADNNEFNNDAPCRSNPLIANLTLVGPADAFPAPTAQQGIELRRGTDAQIFNSIVMWYPNQGVRWSNSATCGRGVTAQGPAAQCASANDAPVIASHGTIDSVRAFPNPIQSGTRFTVKMDATALASLDIFDVAGRRVDSVFTDRMMAAGEHSIDWSLPRGIGAGTYFFRLDSGSNEPAMGKLVVVR